MKQKHWCFNLCCFTLMTPFPIRQRSNTSNPIQEQNKKATELKKNKHILLSVVELYDVIMTSLLFARKFTEGTNCRYFNNDYFKIAMYELFSIFNVILRILLILFITQNEITKKQEEFSSGQIKMSFFSDIIYARFMLNDGS